MLVTSHKNNHGRYYIEKAIVYAEATKLYKIVNSIENETVYHY